MRVTNTMITNNILRNLNNGMTKIDRYLNQMSSGKTNAHISDDPVALIYGQTARASLARLEHYQRSVDSAQSWLTQVEAGMMDLQGRLADVYNSIVDAATDVKSGTDKNNVAMLIGQLRDHYLDTLNATYGDKFMYGGYNTPGNEKGTGSITGPFSLDENTWDLLYNGQNLSNYLQISIGGVHVDRSKVSGIFGGLYLDLSSIEITGNPSTDEMNVRTAVDNLIVDIEDLANKILDLNDQVTIMADDAADYYNNELDSTGLNMSMFEIEAEIANIGSQIQILELPIYDQRYIDFQERLRDLEIGLHDLQPEYSNLLFDLAAKRTEREDTIKELARLIDIDEPDYYEYDPSYPGGKNYDVNNPVKITVGGVELLSGYGTITPPFIEVEEVGDPPITGYENMTNIMEMVDTLKKDVLTFNVGPGVTMQVTVNGIDLVMFESERDNGSFSTVNIFNLLHEGYVACSTGEGAEDIGNFIMALQKSQNHILAKVAEIGGRTRRLDLLSARYEQDYINYTQMMSDAEDVEFDEAAMNYATAQTVYQAALSAGARTIQMSLMDFLK